MTEPPEPQKARCLCLDIETARRDSTVLREVGAYRPDLDARLKISGKARDFAAQLDALTHGAAFVLGHNIVAFDQPVLEKLCPDLTLHRLPLIDTLELSPIAFPQNPYHRLVKDYKLCATTRNDPARDAELAYTLFLDQRQALRERVAARPDEMLCLHYLLASENGKGVSNLFATLRRSLRPDLPETVAAWRRATRGKVCATGERRLLREWLPDPEWRKPLAYALSWLQVAGGNSVLPPWVAHAFPRTRDVIHALRDTPCDDPACGWCREQHDLDALLMRYFGLPGFREKPATADGRSLQRAIVENGMADKPTLAILPTGGGKSLCYQLPALARYYRTGALTVVVSPLQSLMKDQVDNLEQITCAGYLNSLLTPVERRAVLEKLRTGDLGLVFVAPEQFRSGAFTSALAQREIAAWIFDEAHCLSKWGHDFRPDYLYVSRFIKRWQKNRPAPVFCFTATAKPDVVEDIRAHFQERLGMALECLQGGVGRDNLDYAVHAVPVQGKYGETLRLLQEALRGEGSVIVFCARQKTTEELAGFLKEAGLACAHFHGGMAAAEKRAVQEAFVHGDALRVIVATNAFGMGIDKPDVRLVIHFDTPGSLENYLQEAGRAGRDREPARCVLLYDDADLDVQFRLLKKSKLSQHDIQVILKALRAIGKKDRSEGEVVVTSGEILREVPEQHGIDPDARDADTKVRIAVAWLEEARLLERRENHTRVFPGSLLVANLDEARDDLRRKLGEDADIEPYAQILAALMQAGDDEGLSTDELALASGKDSHTLQHMLHELDQWKLLSNDVEIGVTFYRDPDTATRLDALERIEDALFANLRELAPDADRESWQTLNARRLCDLLRRDAGTDCDPGKLTRLLKSFAEPFGEGVGRRAFLALRPGGPDRRFLRLLRDWSDIEQIRKRRMRFARALVNLFQKTRQGNTLLVTCKQGALEAELQADLTLSDLEIKDWDAALSSALLYLDANEVLHLARGKAVFRAAMTIRLDEQARRRFGKSDYAELALHYQDKIVQVHVMAEYANAVLRKLKAAMRFIDDYFSLDRAAFIKTYFSGREDILTMAATEAAHRRILVALANPEQQAIVAAPREESLLVLAGPGAGKTKVIVHRVAWLLREGMALPEEIMVLAYNRLTIAEIRRRLWELVGADAAGVAVQTLHGLAMRLTGTSCAVAIERGETVDFNGIIRGATALLRAAGEGEEGDDASASLARHRLLAGLRFLLVDEYQDINGDYHELISAVAGHALRTEEDRLSLMAVGDDDQNIYGFNHASAQYIRQFETDYRARRHSLLENYRSTAHIIHCANRVIAPARERMKRDQEIRINHARREQPEGGAWATRDPLAAGRVHVLEVPANPWREAAMAADELQRLHVLAANDGEAGQWGSFAVIARRWEELTPLAALCRQRNIPVELVRDAVSISLHETREGFALLSLLRGERRQARKRRVKLRSGALGRWFRRRYGVSATAWIAHPFRAALAQFIAEREAIAPGCEQVVDDLIDALYEFGGGTRTPGAPNAPMLLLVAHRAKGLEFDHVLILDGGGWKAGDDERRLYYVAMTRARQTLTLCEIAGGRHPFAGDTGDLPLRTCPRPVAETENQPLPPHTQTYKPEKIVLSWPGRFAKSAPIHRAIAALEIGDALTLQPRSNGGPGWELADAAGTVVGRMSSKFQLPEGRIVAVRVAAILVRHARPGETTRIKRWELVLPEIDVERLE
ncbi:MAG: RecQ family ATP-dependent DNA helicase [Candidatus Accumulibacter sp.]|jgi:ATP-dependent DNA helicase RecQ|nr:RecQ family ATP-dependent DNA helicase [Accumulibacter sp.]